MEQELAVSAATNVHQSTVSRQIRSALKLFALKLSRGSDHLQLAGDASLLLAERFVHQQARLRGLAPLRVDATYSSGPWLLSSPPEGWVLGQFDLPGMARPLALLAAPDHPLAHVRDLTPGDLEPFPSLALPPGWFPRTEAVLRAQGLWSDEVRIKRYDPDRWEGRCADGVTLTYGQSLTEALQPGTVRLHWNLGLITGEALVVRRDLLDQPAIQQLVEHLQLQAQQVAARFDDVELVE